MSQTGQRAAEAERLMQAGRLDEAAMAWEQVLAGEPGHPRALLHLGQHLLYRGQPQRAKLFLERALAADPSNPMVALNLSTALRALGDVQGEMDALVQALTIDPYFLPALLARGALLERVGQSRAAAKIYADALSILPPDGRVDPWLAEPVARARAVVEQNRAAIADHLEQGLAAVRARHPGADMARFEEARDIMIGAKKAFLSQPTLLAYPRLPAIPFFERRDFPWLAAVEEATDMIRAELLGLLQSGVEGFAPYVRHPDGVPLNQWAGLNHSPDWSAFFLIKDGAVQAGAATACPRTLALLKTLPLAQIPGIAPSAFFSVLKPGTLIPPHTGVTNTRVIVHIPLIVPPGCWFRVGNETREWVPGRALVFDDSIEHEAWNGSDQTRIILIFDIWNPGLSEAEREMVSELMVRHEGYYAS